jgi:hypothetical protein
MNGIDEMRFECSREGGSLTCRLESEEDWAECRIKERRTGENEWGDPSCALGSSLAVEDLRCDRVDGSGSPGTDLLACAAQVDGETYMCITAGTRVSAGKHQVWEPGVCSRIRPAETP